MDVPAIPRKRSETRRRLLQAADEIVERSGIGEAGIGAVCTRAGYTRGAFYSNFVDMDDLFLALYEERVEGFLENAAEAARAALPPDGVPEGGVLGDVVDGVMAVIPAESTWFLVHDRVYARAHEDDAVRRRYGALRTQIFTRLGELLERVLAATGRTAAIGAEDLARIVWSGATGVIRDGRLAGRDRALEDTRRLTTALLAGLAGADERGLAADPGGGGFSLAGSGGGQA